jgi:hypothetical protein
MKSGDDGIIFDAKTHTVRPAYEHTKVEVSRRRIVKKMSVRWKTMVVALLIICISNTGPVAQNYHGQWRTTQEAKAALNAEEKQVENGYKGQKNVLYDGAQFFVSGWLI